MKVLMVLPECPYPAENGPRNHAMGLLRLASSHNSVDVIGFYEGQGGRRRWEHWACEDVGARLIGLVPERQGIRLALATAGAILSCRPAITGRYHGCFGVDPGLYDVLHLDTFKTLCACRRLCALLPSVLVPHDAYSRNFRLLRQSQSRMRQRLRAAVREIAFNRMERYDYHPVTVLAPASEIDADQFRTIRPPESIQVVGIPVLGARKNRDSSGQDGIAHVVVCGVFAVDAIARDCERYVLDCIPDIQRAFPNTRHSIWGKGAPPGLLRAIARAPNTEYRAWVDDYESFLRSASVYVYPQSYSGGIQTKVQQAMKHGIPVVARPSVLAALGDAKGVAGLRCPGVSDMAAAVNSLLASAEMRSLVGRRGEDYLWRMYRPQRVRAQLQHAYEAACRAFGRRVMKRGERV